MLTAFQVVRDDGDFVIRVSGELFTEDELTSLLEFLTFETIRRRSELTQHEADVLAKEIKAAAWNRVRHLFRSSPTRKHHTENREATEN